MAKIEKLIPFLIKWETGIVQKEGESLESLFERAKASPNGFVNDPDDRGGATVIGVTFKTFAADCKKNMNIEHPTVKDLKNISYQTWVNILSKSYWLKWHGDKIENQSVANILVDWVWGSGTHGVKNPQKILGVTADGIVGPKTIEAVNNQDPKKFFEAVKKSRIDFYHRIVARNPSQEKFLGGWINRTNDHKYID